MLPPPLSQHTACQFHGPTQRNRARRVAAGPQPDREGQAMLKVILWIIAFIFIVGLLVVFGILDLIF